MENMKSYIICVTSAAVLCAILNELTGKKGTISSVIRLLTGLFMGLTVISPLVNIDFADISAFTGSIQSDSLRIVGEGEKAAADASADIIKRKTEAYILDKADTLGVSLEVNIILSDTQPQFPCEVYITGAASPYARTQLTAFIEKELGIPQEEQNWSG